MDGASWDSNQDSWPTMEMTSRGRLRGLWVGALIALPSGAGVALSVLGGNAGSLVGVAISASLLPPAVNSGMLWAYSIICAIKHPTLSELPLETNASQAVGHLDCRALKGNSYTLIYSCNMAEEAAIMAIISLVLTIVNIICILITATLVLKFKEVVPKASSSNATQTFWTKDIKVAREAYQTLHGNKAKNFLKEWKKVCHNSDQQPQSSIQNEAQLLDMIQEVEEDQGFQTVLAKAPQGRQYINQCSRELKDQISVEEEPKSDVDEEAMALFHLWTIHNQYTAHNKSGVRQRHVETLFEELPSEPEAKPKPKKEGREFVVTDIDKPHHTSVVRVRPPSEKSEKYSVSKESGV